MVILPYVIDNDFFQCIFPCKLKHTLLLKPYIAQKVVLSFLPLYSSEDFGSFPLRKEIQHSLFLFFSSKRTSLLSPCPIWTAEQEQEQGWKASPKHE